MYRRHGVYMANRLSLGSQASFDREMWEKNKRVLGQGLSVFPNQLLDQVAASEIVDQQSITWLTVGFRHSLFPHGLAICKCHTFAPFSYFTSVLVADDNQNSVVIQNARVILL